MSASLRGVECLIDFDENKDMRTFFCDKRYENLIGASTEMLLVVFSHIQRQDGFGFHRRHFEPVQISPYCNQSSCFLS